MSKFTKCFNCDRGGRGNAKDKCACGWQVTKDGPMGCYLGAPITGKPRRPAKISKAKQRYQNYLYSEIGEEFGWFITSGYYKRYEA